jgi:hypothetical protein
MPETHKIMIQQTVSTRSEKSLPKAILITGLIAGLMDAAGAIIHYLSAGRKDPIKIFNFIASGVFGKDGLTGGMPMAILGFVFHMIIATIWATIFFFLCSRLKLYTKNWIVVGLAYGVVVWLGMNLVVVPLSNTPPMNRTPSGVLIGTIILMLCIGLPCAYSAKRYFRGE